MSDDALKNFDRLVTNKYKLYNSLFMNLPFDDIAQTGMFIPLLSEACRTGFEKGMSPEQIVMDFFDRYTNFENEEDQISFLFKVIQYVERQVVLFDSIEDAAFTKIHDKNEQAKLKDLFTVARSTGRDESIKDKLNSFGIRYVFTAHPTQFYPPSVQRIIRDLRKAIGKDSIDQINALLKQLGRTSFINAEKPTPFQEAQSIIFYLRNIYYQVVREVYKRVNKQMFDGETLENHGLVSLGFWPGGDRDGNPFVKADTTIKVADELRMTLMKCYYNQLKDVRRRLTFRGVEEVLSLLSDKLYRAMFEPTYVLSYDEILEPLILVRQILVDKYDSLFIDHLDDLIYNVRIFKTHFATVDVRQDHSVHKGLVHEIITKYGKSGDGLENLPKEEILSRLEDVSKVLESNMFEDPLFVDTIDNIKGLKSIQDTNGELGCNRYIISNSEDENAVLFVKSLFRLCGWQSSEISFDIVPLFETIKGMANAENTMSILFSRDDYRQHIERRGNRQIIMLGFSDGTKDGGYLKANWEILKTKERLTTLCESYGVDVVFFDGRGGPPARGGGKTQRFYASQGSGVANREIQLTIQGQTISSMYGTKDQFAYNCEQLLAAGLTGLIDEKISHKTNSSYRTLMDELADISYQKYVSLKTHPSFVPYLEEMSTLQYYKRAKVGSRPGKRGKKKELTLSDLRAISFVGSWSQLKQNVPGYYGIGSALASLKEQGRLDEVKKLYQEFPFFKALIRNSMMSMTKSFFPLTSYMQHDKKYGEFWNLLHDEFLLSKDLMLEIAGYSTLMEEEMVSKKSIQIREDIVLPLITIQQYALQQIKKGRDDTSSYEKIVTRSLIGNINASRNSA